MRYFNFLSSMAFAGGVAGLMASAFGGSVITSNLPTDTAIINISGTQDGAATYNGPDQAYWYQPFNLSGVLTQYTLQAGTYTFQIINPADAATMFPALAAGQLSEIFTGWTYNSPWITQYLVFNESAQNDASEYQLLTGAVGDRISYSNATDAYNAAKAGGYDDELMSGPNGRTNGTVTTSWTFAAPTTLIFAIPDYYLPDNAGGVSVLIAKTSTVAAVPLPSSVWMGLDGLGGLLAIGLMRRFRRHGLTA